MILVALRPVLYLSKQYKTGDELPTGDASMVSAWISAGSAVWKQEAEINETAKAAPAAARAGMAGKSSSGDPDDLAGVAPAKTKRSRKRKSTDDGAAK